jgi:Flp pilus assembly protein TadD
MALQATLHHPLAQIARELDRLVAARDAAALRALLRGEGTPSFSRDGDEPGELCWLAIRRFAQPRKPWLDELGALTAALASEVADAAARNAAEVSASGNEADSDDAARESYVFNLFLFASYQPASAILFDELARFRSERLDLPVFLSGRTAAQLQTAIHTQQTDARLATVWIDELTTVCTAKSLAMSARAEALSLWQALLWMPPAAADEELSRSHLLLALAALAGENADTPAADRVNMVQTALDELEVLYQHSSDFWRRFFRTDDDHLALRPWVWELIEDRWPDEQSPEFSLQGETRDFWRMLPIAIRVRLRGLAQNVDEDWNKAFFDLLSSDPAVPFIDALTWKKQVTALKASLDKVGGRNPKIKIVERELKKARPTTGEAARPRRQESAVLSLERVTRTLAVIERELAHRRGWKAREFFDDLLEREQTHGTPDELIAKTVSSTATLAAKHGDLPWAELLWLKARSIAPNDPITANGLADTFNAQQRYGEAEALYRQTMSVHPDNAVTASGLADTLKSQERYAEAEALYRQTMTSHPNNAVVASGLADTLKAQERYAEAEALYRQTMTSHPNNAVVASGLADTLKAQERYAEAEALYRQTMTSHPHDSVPVNSLAETLKAQERYAEAEALYRQTMTSHPNNPVVANGLADTLKAQERYAEAEALYRQTMTSHPNDAVVANGLADTLKAQERYAEAETLYRQTMTSHPNDAVVASGLADTLKAQERYAEAEALYRQTMTSHPNNPVVANGLADTLKAQERYAEAETLYRATLAVHRADAVALHALANLLRIQGRTAEALDALDTIRTSNPRQLRYVAHLKAVIIADDDPERALALLESSLQTCRTERDRDRFHATTAAIQLRLKRYEDAGNSARALAVDAPAAAKVVQLHAFRAAGNDADAAEVRAWLATQTLLARIQSAVSKVDLLFSTVANRDQAERELISEELDLLVAS